LMITQVVSTNFIKSLLACILSRPWNYFLCCLREYFL
jgi:hypothetical protein